MSQSGSGLNLLEQLHVEMRSVSTALCANSIT